VTRKIWTIPTQTGGLRGNGAIHPRLAPTTETLDRPDTETAQSNVSERSSFSPHAGHPSRTLILSYFLGPVGLLASEGGRSNPVWVVLAGLSVGTAVLVGRRFHEIAGALRQGQGLGFLLFALGLITWILAAAAMARGVKAGGEEASRAASGRPLANPSPLLALALGLVVPGLGLHLSRSPGRAAAALAGVGALGVGAIALWFAAPLWTWNHVSPFGGASDLTMEIAFLAAALLCVFGAVVWVSQALDGMRQAGLLSPPASSPRSDRFGLALLVALAVLAVGFRPGLWAAECDFRAEWAEAHGLRLTPLGLAELARHLDPSRPDYALRAARLNESLGRRTAAEAIEKNLGSSWSLYLAGMGGQFHPGSPMLNSDSGHPSPVIAIPRDPLTGCPMPEPSLAPQENASVESPRPVTMSRRKAP